MGLLPKNNAERIAWFQNRTSLWTTNATAIGSTAAQISDVVTKATAAAAALAAQGVAQDAAKAATETLNNAMVALTNSGNIVIEQVHTKARTAGDSVYPLANIPAPATPAPKPAPGKPTDLVVKLDVTGVLHLSWKCPNPEGTSGTIYQIWRRIGASGPFAYLGGIGTKSFDDDTLPAGSSSVTYQIQGARSTASGEWARFEVNFGVDNGGAMTASVVERVPAKMAA